MFGKMKKKMKYCIIMWSPDILYYNIIMLLVYKYWSTN